MVSSALMNGSEFRLSEIPDLRWGAATVATALQYQDLGKRSSGYDIVTDFDDVG